MNKVGSPLERAFDLARSGQFQTIQKIRDRLRHEGYSDAQVYSRALSKQLRELIVVARSLSTSRDSAALNACFQKVPSLSPECEAGMSNEEVEKRLAISENESTMAVALL